MNLPSSGRTLADVSVDITVQCVDDEGTQHDIDTVLGYRRTDPYAVTMTFLTSEGDLVWTFARDLLSVGLHGPAGEGDVHVAPGTSAGGHAMLDVSLSSPDGHLVLHVRADQVTEFVARAHEIVPMGAESFHVDVDGLVAQILNAR